MSAIGPGTVLGARFELEAEAGSGGMGMVYRALDRQSGARVAVKVLKTEGAQDVERFLREGALLADLHHPRIVRYVAHGATAASQHYIAMEWLEGETLAARLETAGLTAAESLRVGYAVADALGAAHERGILHRDLKPHNVLLVGGSLETVKLLDFGVARPLRGEQWLTRTGMIIGTPGYMAPEQVRAERAIGPPADVFALGCLLFKCLTGEDAYAGETLLAMLARVLVGDAPRVRDVVAKVAPEIDDLVGRMMARDPSARPADGKAAAAAIDAIADRATGASIRTAARVSRGITVGEQRLVCVITVGPVSNAEQAAAALPDIVETYGAELDRVGKGLFLVLVTNANVTTDQVARAARCALAIRAALPDAPMVLAMGRAVVSDRRPTGEIVDRATRITDAVPGRIRVDGATSTLLEDRFVLERLGPNEIVLEGEQEASDKPRLVLGHATPFVGRDREIAIIESSFEQSVKDSVARAVVVTAVAGLGKSRLRIEAVERLRARDDSPPLVLLGRGDPISAGAPLAILSDALRRLLGLRAGESTLEARAKLVARVARLGASQAQSSAIAAPLSEIMTLTTGPGGAARAPEDARPASERASADAMLAAFLDWMELECSRHPVAVVLDDLHWGDRPSVDFVDAALRHLGERHFFVLAFGRPEIADLFPRLWQRSEPQEVRLAGLTTRAAAALAREALGPDVPDEAISDIVRSARGNAFFLEELVRAYADGRRTELPETVLGMVQARLDALGPQAKRTLRAASVFGDTFWARGIAHVLGESSQLDRVTAECEELADREVVVRQPRSILAGESEWTFAHNLVREAAYAALTDSDRALGHRMAGEWLEQTGAADPYVVAQHFDRGGERERAAPGYLRAADKANVAGDYAAAIERAKRGLACGARDELRARLRSVEGAAHAARGDAAAAAEACADAAAGFAPGSAPWFVALDEQLFAVARQGLHEEAATLLARIRSTDAAPDAGAEDAKLAALARAAIVALRLGGFAASSGVAELVAQIAGARPGGLGPLSMPRVSTVRALVARARGEADACIALHEMGNAVLREHGDWRSVCLNQLSLASVLGELGRGRETEELLRDSHRIATKLQMGSTLGLCEFVLALWESKYGDRALARTMVARALDLNVGEPMTRARALVLDAEIAASDGDADRSERAACEAIALGDRDPMIAGMGRAWLARALVARGRAESAVAAAREALERTPDATGFEEGESAVRVALVEALLAAGDREAAREQIARARDRLEARASRLVGQGWRASFLEGVPDNARTMELARELGA